MTHFRNGQWVKFEVSGPWTESAHKSADGRIVGIFVRGGIDATGQVSPTRIMVVNGLGMNLMVPSETGESLAVALNPAKAKNIEAVTSRDDIPKARLTTMRTDWTPRA